MLNELSQRHSTTPMPFQATTVMQRKCQASPFARRSQSLNGHSVDEIPALPTQIVAVARRTVAASVFQVGYCIRRFVAGRCASFWQPLHVVLCPSYVAGDHPQIKEMQFVELAPPISRGS